VGPPGPVSPPNVVKQALNRRADEGRPPPPLEYAGSWCGVQRGGRPEPIPLNRAPRVAPVPPRRGTRRNPGRARHPASLPVPCVLSPNVSGPLTVLADAWRADGPPPSLHYRLLSWATIRRWQDWRVLAPVRFGRRHDGPPLIRFPRWFFRRAQTSRNRLPCES